jgi:asparagine synthetase B (glutamine-hydrolysing)
MYAKMGDCDELWNSLDGIFACVIVDDKTGHYIAARDPMGICSFYWGKGSDGSVWFSSELKALQDNCESFECFPPVCSKLPCVKHCQSTCATNCDASYCLVLHLPRFIVVVRVVSVLRAIATAAKRASYNDGSIPAGLMKPSFPLSQQISKLSGSVLLASPNL